MPATGSPWRALPFVALGASLLTGLLIDPMIAGARWWASPDRADIAEAMAFPVGLWFMLAAGIIVLPRLLGGRRPTRRGVVAQSLWVAATSAVAWLPITLILEDALGPTDAPHLALPLSVLCGITALVTALWPHGERTSS